MRKLNGGLMAAIALALLASGFNAEARLGKSSSASRSSGYSSPSRPSGATAPRPYTPPPSRIGGGTSGGMQRSDAMNQARAMRGAPASPAPAGTAAGAAGAAGGSSMIGRNVAPAAPVAPGVAPGAAPGTPAAPRGFSTGQMIGGAAAGALGGYVLGRAMAPDAAPPPATTGAAGTSADSPAAPTAGQTPAGTTGGAGGAWNAGNTDGTSASAQDARGGVGLPGNPDSSRGGPSMMPFLLLLALLAGAVLYFFKKKSGALVGANARKSPSSGLGFGQGEGIAPLNSPEQELLAQAPGIYRRLQDANNAADTVQMRRLVDESYLPVLLNALPNRVEPSRTRVLSLDIKENRVLDFRQEGGKQVGSIYFVARLDEGDGAANLVEEVWHFVKPNQSADWKLAGIEALT